jgi:hypothetical protein
MSARILDFPSARRRLELEGYTLIAWRRGAEADEGEEPWLHGLWRPADGMGWYQSGWCRPGKGIRHQQISRAHARAGWGEPVYREPYNWRYLCGETEAFPPRRRRVPS